jgi:hypothetical protein
MIKMFLTINRYLLFLIIDHLYYTWPPTGMSNGNRSLRMDE